MPGKTVSSLIVALVFLTVAYVSDVSSDDFYSRSYSDSPLWYEQMNAIKARVATVLKTNKELEAQYSKLKAEVDQMQGVRNPYDDVVSPSNTGLSIEMPAMFVEPEREAQNQEFEEEYIGEVVEEDVSAQVDYNVSAGAKYKLRELQLQDLVYQKRTLELELQLRKFNFEQRQNEIRKEWENLQSQLENQLIEEKKLKLELSQVQRDLELAPEAVPKMDFQNQQMALNLEELSKKLDFQNREIQIVKDKILLAERNKDRIAFDKVEKKSRLQNEVDILDEEYSRINSQVNLSLSRQSRKQELIRAIIEYDKQNQEIINRIEKLKTRLGKK